MKTKILLSILVALIAILVSSCIADATSEGNVRRLNSNYPYLNELNGFALVDSVFQRIYTPINFPNTSDARMYEPQTCGIMIKVTENNNQSDSYIAFEDLLYDGSLDRISGSKLSAEVPKVDCNKDSNPALIKANKSTYALLRKRVEELATIELNKRHDAKAKNIQNIINTLVPFEKK